MALDKKLVLEELEDETLVIPDVEAAVVGEPIIGHPEDEQLSEEEKDNFNTNVVADLLSNFANLYAMIQANLLDANLKEDVKALLEDVSGDAALIIGKLQESFKVATPEGTEDIIEQGEEEAKEITKEE